MIKTRNILFFLYRLAYNLIVDLGIDSAISGLPLQEYSYSFDTKYKGLSLIHFRLWVEPRRLSWVNSLIFSPLLLHVKMGQMDT